MNNIIHFSLNHRPVVIAGWFLILIAGLYSMLRLPIDAVPDVTNIQVQVLTNAPGQPPEDVERFITFPVETAMSGLPEVEEIRSVSKFGLSVVTIVFHDGTDIYRARQWVGERLGEAREAIPETYGRPEMGPISTGLGEIYQFEVRGAEYSPMELRTLLDWTINNQLRGVPGVAEVNAFGGELQTWQVSLKPDRLAAYGLTIGEVVTALEANNRNVGGGYLERQGEQYLIQGVGMISSLEDVAAILVKRIKETPVYVGDIAVVERAPMLRQGAVTRDGKGEAVIGIVMMLMGENPRIVSRNVHEKIAQIQATLPEGVEIDTFYNRTELVNRTITTVAKNLAEGGLLVMLVLLLLLGSPRAGLIVTTAIPLSMLVAFIAMEAAGISGNLMSLGALDFGLIVDGSVVLIENVMRYLHHHRDDTRPHLEKVREACLEVARPVTFAVGIIVVVYVPLLGLGGIEGKMFKPMALTVVFALMGSLLCALTLMPVLASLFLKRVRETEPPLFRLAKWLYRPALARATAHPRAVLLAAVLVFLGSLTLLPFMGREFIPRLDEGSIAMQIWRLPSISLEKSNEISLQVESVIMEEFPEVTTVISRTGRAEIATDPMGVEISDTYLMLKPPAQWRHAHKEALLEDIDQTLKARIPGAIFSYSQPIQLRVSELISGARSDLAVKIYGDDMDLLKEKADEVTRILGAIEGAADVKAEQVMGLPSLRIKLDRVALARNGIPGEAVLDVIESLGGKQVGVVLEGNRRFALQVRLEASQRSSAAAIGALLIGADHEGGTRRIPLSQLAEITIEDGPAQISRDNISRRISIEANVRGRDLGSFVAEAQQAMAEKLDLPDGWYVRWGGQFEHLETASKRLALLVPLALLLILFLLYTTFHSGRSACLIFLNVPLAVSGGIFALYLRGLPLSISAGVGFIALFGVAVLNGVVLVSHMAALTRAGVDPLTAASSGALTRLRPVLMTALVASLGFVPMALASSAGAEVQRPLATVVIGGLVTSTLLTLLVLPAIYRWFVKPMDATIRPLADRHEGSVQV